MAVIISHVCGQWRTLSLGVPTLWTTFYHVAYMSKQHDILPRLEAFLQRSTSHLLDIWIDYRGIQKAAEKGIGSVMIAAAGHVHRWSSFVLFQNATFPFSEFIKQLENVAAPNLETFCIPALVDFDRLNEVTTNSITVGTIPSSPCIFKKGAPKLALTGLDVLGLRFSLPPLSHLVSLYVTTTNDTGDIPMPSFISLLKQTMDNLTSLTLDRIFSRDWHYNYLFQSRPTLSTPNLVRLRISNQPIVWGQFPRCWKMPLLETITFYKVDFGGGTFTSTMIEAPNLHSVFSTDCSIKSRDNSFAQFTSNVRKIVFSDSRWRPNSVTPLELLDNDYARPGQPPQGRWLMLQDITVNLRNPGRHSLEFFLRCFQTCPKSHHVTLRIDPTVLHVWRTLFAPRLEELANYCTIETLDDSISYIPSPWPVTTPDGPFGSMFEKIDLPLIKRYPLVT